MSNSRTKEITSITTATAVERADAVRQGFQSIIELLRQGAGESSRFDPFAIALLVNTLSKITASVLSKARATGTEEQGTPGTIDRELMRLVQQLAVSHQHHFRAQDV